MEIEIRIDLFKALSDENRLRILLLLRKHGKMTVNEVKENMNISQSNVSRHLGLLKSAGLTLSQKQANKVYYFLNEEYIQKSLKTMISLFLAAAPPEVENGEDNTLTPLMGKKPESPSPETGKDKLLRVLRNANK